MRVGLDHHARASGLQRWKLGLAIAGAVAVAVAVAVVVAAGRWEALASPGPLAEAHARAGIGCDGCHLPLAGVADRRCVACHAGFEREGCARCHVEHGRAPLRANEPWMRMTIAAPVGPTTAFAARPGLAFSHRVHAGERGIACSDCHVASNAPGDNGREFDPVSYSACVRCHAAPIPGLPTTAALAGTWHGTTGCVSCHSGPRSSTLRTVAARSARRYAFESRGHINEADAAGAPRREGAGTACNECHVEGSLARRPREGAFDHFDHTSERNDVDQCRACHPGMDGYASLADAGSSLDACTTPCHAPAVLETVEESRPSGGVPRVDFSHAAHGATACLDCHGWPQGAGAAVGSTPGVAGCQGAACHAEHANIGGGACASCHAMNDIRWAVTPWTRPPGASFSHETAGHGGACLDCHRSVASSERLPLDVPPENGAGCVVCHGHREDPLESAARARRPK